MKKVRKIIVVFLAVFLVAVAAASIVVNSYLQEDKIRDIILEMSEKKLGRNAGLGSVDVSIFRGIVIRDFEIREKDSDSVFFKTREFVLAYQFLPLLRKKLIIEKLSIADAELNIRANDDGTYNFSDMTRKDKPDVVEDHKDEKAAGLPLDLNVRNITIKNAKLGYTDPAGKLKKTDVIINAGLTIAGLSQNALSSEGSVNITIAEALLKEGNKAFKDIALSGRYKIDLDTAASRVIVHRVDMDIIKIPVAVTGSVNYAPAAAYALAVTVPDVNLSSLPQDLLAAFLPAGMALGGNISANVDLDKKPDDTPLRFDGSLNMKRLTCKFKNMNLMLDGSVKLGPEIISLEGLNLISGQNQARITGSVKDYRQYPDVHIAVHSPNIALDEIFVSQPKAGEAQSKTADVKPGKEQEPINIKMKAGITLDIDKTVYRGIAINNFSSRYELKNNVLNIPYLKGNTLSGKFAVRANIDLAQRGTRYQMNADLNDVRIEEIINAFAPKAKDKLFGILSGNAEINGSGTLSENIKRNLKGRGEFAIKDGALRNSELSAGLLDIIGLRDMKEVPIEKANGNFIIGEGIVNLTMAIAGKDLAIDEKGTIGLDEKLDLGILVKVSDRLAPKLVSQSSIAAFLSSEKGWTSIPLRVKGTISKPSYGVDTRFVGKKVTESMQKKVGEELQRILLKDTSDSSKSAPASSGEQPQSPTPADRIRDLLGK